jgi:hypothetical protein
MHHIKHIQIAVAVIALALFVVLYPTSWLGTAVLLQCVGTPIIFVMMALPMLLWRRLKEGPAPREPYSYADPPHPHGHRKGQKVILPDGTLCRVTEINPFWPMTALEPVSPRAYRDREILVTEAFIIQPGGEVILAKTWHWGPGPCHGSEPTGWTLADLRKMN